MTHLLEEPGRYDFYQALRLLEGGAVAGISGQPIGFDHEPQFEVARLRVSPSLGFAANAIEGVTRRRSPVAGAAKAVDMTVTFMGGLGANGILPWHYTEYVFERLSQRDKALRDFVDTLEHRSITFHYRAWQKYRLPFAHEAAHRRSSTDDITATVRAVVGLGTQHLRERVVEGADRWLYFAGLFARRQRTADGLEVMLREVCGHPVRVQEFCGRWQKLVPEERSRLGGRDDDELRNQLGSSLILGDRVWDVLSGVRICIGPVASQFLRDLMPGARVRPMIGELVRSYLGPDVDFEIVCSVAKTSIQPLQLGAPDASLGGDADRGARLGASTWIAAGDADRYDAEVPLCTSR